MYMEVRRKTLVEKIRKKPVTRHSLENRRVIIAKNLLFKKHTHTYRARVKLQTAVQNFSARIIKRTQAHTFQNVPPSHAKSWMHSLLTVYHVAKLFFRI